MYPYKIGRKKVLVEQNKVMIGNRSVKLKK